MAKCLHLHLSKESTVSPPPPLLVAPPSCARPSVACSHLLRLFFCRVSLAASKAAPPQFVHHRCPHCLLRSPPLSPLPHKLGFSVFHGRSMRRLLEMKELTIWLTMVMGKHHDLAMRIEKFLN